YGVTIMMNAEVRKLVVGSSKLVVGSDQSAAGSKQFSISLGNKKVIDADFVCVACGGYPKSVQYEWLRSLGHHIEDPVPSLFTFNMPGNPITALMGVSVENVLI